MKIKDLNERSDVKFGDRSRLYATTAIARQRYPLAKSDEEALMLYLADKERTDVEQLKNLSNRLERTETELSARIDDVEQQVNQDTLESDMKKLTPFQRGLAESGSMFARKKMKEDASCGGTSAGAVASVAAPLGGVKKRVEEAPTYNQHYVRVGTGDDAHVSTFATKDEAAKYLQREKAKGKKTAYKFLKGGAGVTTPRGVKQPFIDEGRYSDEDWGDLDKKAFKRRELEHELGHEVEDNRAKQWKAWRQKYTPPPKKVDEETKEEARNRKDCERASAEGAKSFAAQQSREYKAGAKERKSYGSLNKVIPNPAYNVEEDKRPYDMERDIRDIENARERSEDDMIDASAEAMRGPDLSDKAYFVKQAGPNFHIVDDDTQKIVKSFDNPVDCHRYVGELEAAGAYVIEGKQIFEGRVKELSMDLSDMSEAEFKKKYKKTKKEFRDMDKASAEKAKKTVKEMAERAMAKHLPK